MTETRPASYWTPRRLRKRKAPTKQAKPRVYEIAFARIYPLYIQKAEVDEVIAWLTGYSGKALERAIDNNIDLETFFAEAPRMNANAALPRRRSAPREPGTGEQG